MKRGLFKVDDPFLGLCAHVGGDNGDAYPLLRHDIYAMMGFQPVFDQLPSRSDYELRRARILGT